ncbi:MAG: hypothetical protein RJQ03_05250, partial [Miltoncostaeaceae bacterium]
SLFSAANAAGAVGLLWLSAISGGGPAAAGGIIGAALLAFVVAGPVGALAVAHGSRRHLLLAASVTGAASLAAVAVAGASPGTAWLIGAAIALGLARALYDATATDILQQLVDPTRVLDAMRDLTRRFGRGQALGLAAALSAGFIAGPRGVILAAAALALAAAAMVTGHGARIDLRPEGSVPAHVAMARAVRVIRHRPTLRRSVTGGAAAVAMGSALSALLILWLRDGVGLRGSLIPTLILGFMVVRLARPALLAMALRVPGRVLVALALGLQAGTAVAAHGASGIAGAAGAYALSLASGALLATLILQAHRRAAPRAVAPGVGAVCGMAWALAAAAGAAGAAVLATGLGIGQAYLVLGALAAGGAALTITPLALRPLHRS